MRKRPSMTRVGSIAKRTWVEPLAAVGKPYKSPGWGTVCGDLLALKRTLCGPENRSDSAGDCLSLFDLNRRTMYESAPTGSEVLYVWQLAKHPTYGVLDLRGLPSCAVALRITRWLVPTTLSRGMDDHHPDLFPFASGEIYFLRSEFWTEEKRRGYEHTSVKGYQ